MNPKDSITRYKSVSELARLIRTRELSPVEVVESCISDIERYNPSLNAFVYFGFEEALKAASESEKRLMQGYLDGAMHGVPVAIKDLFDFKPGWPSTFGGIRALKDFRTDFYCSFAERVENAGAIIVGKTNSPTMGFRGTCDNFLFGPTKNPFNLDYNSGGSSGGSVSAVASGLLPMAEGTDGGGSIRIPASWCGVVGYKPSFGTVPLVMRPNAFGGDTPFIFEGPITRNVEDAALVMSTIAGFNAADPYSVYNTINFSEYQSSVSEPLKIAYSPDLDVFPVDPRIRNVIDNAVRLFEDMGAKIEEVKLGFELSQKEMSDLWCRLIMPLNVRSLDSLKAANFNLLEDNKNDFPQEYLNWIEVGKRMTAVDFLKDQEKRTSIFDKIQAVLDKFDLLITPTLACLPVLNGDDGNTMGPTRIEGETVDPLIGWCLTYPFNFTGHPAASIPAGQVKEFPIGMQIVGNRFKDDLVLSACARFEQMQPWAHTYKEIIL